MSRLVRLLVLSLILAALAPACGSPEPEKPAYSEIVAWDPPGDQGMEIHVAWSIPDRARDDYVSFSLERAGDPDGPWVEVTQEKGGKTAYEIVDKAENLDLDAPEAGETYYYRVEAKRKDGETVVSEVAGPVVPRADWWEDRKTAVLLAIAIFSAFVFVFIRLAKRNPDIYIRPIGGLAAMSEAIGRATEMGKPILYVPGIADMDDIQTITSLVIMREVSKEAAEYETRVIVPCRSPVVMTAAEEAVRTGFMEAGAPDLFNPDDVRFLSDEQFAFTAATNGIMLRERPATNIYMGAFWAESLILAETGFLAGAIQIAGTANVSQLPFFVAACDYTLIGEEIYAASAYLSREPILLGSLKGSDWAKTVFAGLMLLGFVLAGKVAKVDETFGEASAAVATEAADLPVMQNEGQVLAVTRPTTLRLKLEAVDGDVAIEDVWIRSAVGPDDVTGEPLPDLLRAGSLATTPDGWAAPDVEFLAPLDPAILGRLPDRRGEIADLLAAGATAAHLEGLGYSAAAAFDLVRLGPDGVRALDAVAVFSALEAERKADTPVVRWRLMLEGRLRVTGLQPLLPAGWPDEKEAEKRWSALGFSDREVEWLREPFAEEPVVVSLEGRKKVLEDDALRGRVVSALRDAPTTAAAEVALVALELAPEEARELARIGPDAIDGRTRALVLPDPAGRLRLLSLQEEVAARLESKATEASLVTWLGLESRIQAADLVTLGAETIRGLDARRTYGDLEAELAKEKEADGDRILRLRGRLRVTGLRDVLRDVLDGAESPEAAVAELEKKLLFTERQARDLALLGSAGLDAITRESLAPPPAEDGHADLPAGKSIVTCEVTVTGPILVGARARAKEGSARLRLTVLAAKEPLWGGYVEFFE